jgi:uncharacterized membrane protein
MQSDLIYIFIWWATFFTLGIVSIPLCWYLFKKFIDKGYGFAKALGLLSVGYLYFLLGTFHIAPFVNISLVVVLLILALVNFKIFRTSQPQIVKDYKKNFKIILLQELLFTSGLLFWSYVRAHQPDINGLEKFMDFGFINSILKSKFLPPVDMWFAGESINYYWFGHYLVAVATKLSGLGSSVTYNLMLATILGLTLTGVFSLVATLISHVSHRVSLPTICLLALLSAILVNFAGNFHTAYYVIKDGSDTYWYPDATRFIGYNPETNDKTIHEFPIYSYVVSDLHAHLLNLPFVVAFIALLLSFTMDFDEDKHPKKKILLLGFFLGVFFMTNAWDFANYSLLTAVVFGTFLLFKKRVDKKTLLTFLTTGIIMFATALVTMLPFLLHFTSLAEGIKLVHSHSIIWQLIILWGFPAVLTIIFLLFISRNIKLIQTPDIFVLAMLITTWSLIVLPEIIYVKDIYIASHYRANTMFKLTYQAFVISYITSGYVFYRFVSSLKSRSVKFLVTLLLLFPVAAILIYPSYAIGSYYNDLKKYKGLDGTSWAKITHPARFGAVNWLNKNVAGQPVILEAPGDSYTEFNIISSYTGLPTVSGWFVHEWLWRGDSSFPQQRVSDINLIYTSDDENLTKALLDKYKVVYVIIGDQELQKFPNINEIKFEHLAKLVFSVKDLRMYKVN